MAGAIKFIYIFLLSSYLQFAVKQQVVMTFHIDLEKGEKY